MESLDRSTVLTSVRWIPKGKAKEYPDTKVLSHVELKALLTEMTESSNSAEITAGTQDKGSGTLSKRKTVNSEICEKPNQEGESNMDDDDDGNGKKNDNDDEDVETDDNDKDDDDDDGNGDDDKDMEDDEDQRETRKELLQELVMRKTGFTDIDGLNLEKLVEGEFAGNQFFSCLEEDLAATINDPYLRKSFGGIGNAEETDYDTEDYLEKISNRIYPTDYPILVCSADHLLPALEVYIYDSLNGSLYVHHDITLGAPPLCCEWINRAAAAASVLPKGEGCCSEGRNNVGEVNLAAVGSYGHGAIEIWNIDAMDELEPLLVLGHVEDLPSTVRPNKTKSKKKPVTLSSFHTDSVLALHKNQHKPFLLASASADMTVKLWDLDSVSCLATLTHHQDKVQILQWHPVEESILLTAAYDRRFAVVDARQPNSCNPLSGSTECDPEASCWDCFNPSQFWLSTDDGLVRLFDLRHLSQDSQPIHKFRAHEKACTGIASSNSVADLMVTCSLSGHAAVWNSKLDCAPVKVYEKDLKAGPLFCVANNPDESTIFTFGGNMIVIWDVANNDLVNRSFGLPLVMQDETDAKERTRSSSSTSSAAAAATAEDKKKRDEKKTLRRKTEAKNTKRTR